MCTTPFQISSGHFLLCILRRAFATPPSRVVLPRIPVFRRKTRAKRAIFSVAKRRSCIPIRIEESIGTVSNQKIALLLFPSLYFSSDSINSSSRQVVNKGNFLLQVQSSRRFSLILELGNAAKRGGGEFSRSLENLLFFFREADLSRINHRREKKNIYLFDGD